MSQPYFTLTTNMKLTVSFNKYKIIIPKAPFIFFILTWKSVTIMKNQQVNYVWSPFREGEISQSIQLARISPLSLEGVQRLKQRTSSHYAIFNSSLSCLEGKLWDGTHSYHS